MLVVVALTVAFVVGGALSLGLVVEHQVAAAHAANRRARERAAERARLERLLQERLAEAGFAGWDEFVASFNAAMERLGAVLRDAFEALAPVVRSTAEAFEQLGAQLAVGMSAAATAVVSPLRDAIAASAEWQHERTRQLATAHELGMADYLVDLTESRARQLALVSATPPLLALRESWAETQAWWWEGYNDARADAWALQLAERRPDLVDVDPWLGRHGL